MLVYIILAIVILLALVFVFIYMRKKKKALKPMEKGGAIGGIIGMLSGIVLVEFFGYDYPLPFILFLLGIAAGQAIGYLYQRKK